MTGAAQRFRECPSLSVERDTCHDYGSSGDLANARQREEWNGATGCRWMERHAAMDAQIAPFGRQAMDRAAVRPSARVLDVGCGCGETTFELARRVGETGEVVGSIYPLC
jgi:cyclopropane fatty-acyl-phospholipid synthase-like methyltransferase